MGVDLKSIQTKKKKKESTGIFIRLQKALDTDISFKKGISDKVKSKFFSEFAVLLKSGLDLNTILEIVSEGSKKKKETEVFNTIKNNVINGDSLSEALAKTKAFNDFEYHTIKIGEESGKVAIVLEDLAKYYKRKVEQLRSLYSMLSYPFIVLLIAIGAVIFMLNYIVPMFEEVFLSFGGELPTLTKTVLKLSDLLSRYSLLLLFAVFLIALIIATQRKKIWFKKIGSNYILKLPLIGELTKKIYLSRFCHSMHLLSLSKSPLLNSIQLVQSLVSFYPLNTALEKIEKDLIEGKSLNKSMGEIPFFNRKIISLIKVGEEVNKLELVFHQIEEEYQNEIENQSQIISNILEPILIIFVGGLVAIILIAMYMPLFNLGNSAI